VGRTVHYVSHGTPVRADGSQAYTRECRAAIITQVTPDDSTVGLAVLNPTGMFFHPTIPYGDGEHDGGTWHWPERVE
jgi:hypothetical protein